MPQKLRLWGCFLLILALAWVDYRYLNEGHDAALLNEGRRRVGHLLILGAVMVIGYIGWYTHPQQWLKSLWLACYTVAIITILAVGFLSSRYHIFSPNVLDSFYNFRLIFCGPIPFLVLYIFSRIATQKPTS